MDINRFTEKLQEAIRSAQSTAQRYGQQQIDVEHLLAALLEQEGQVGDWLARHDPDEQEEWSPAVAYNPPPGTVQR